MKITALIGFPGYDGIQVCWTLRSLLDQDESIHIQIDSGRYFINKSPDFFEVRIFPSMTEYQFFNLRADFPYVIRVGIKKANRIIEWSPIISVHTLGEEKYKETNFEDYQPIPYLWI